MAPDGKQLPKSGTATPFELPLTSTGDYFAIPTQTIEKKYLAGCRALDSLARLIVSLESFFHPNNAGSWTTDVSPQIFYSTL
jgi:proteasome activator subunit 4